MKRKGIHANNRSDLRPRKEGEIVVYWGGGFHIIKEKCYTRHGKNDNRLRKKKNYK